MKPLEQTYFKRCKSQVIKRVGLGDLTYWRSRDYEKLCELIHSETGILLSLSTIKRVLNDGFNQLPQKATLNALAKYIGYADWFDYMTASETDQTFLEQNNEQLLTTDLSGKRNRRIFVWMFFILLLVIVGFIAFRTGKTIIHAPNDAVRSVIEIDTLSGKKFPGLALTPPMGWNGYNIFGENANENLIRQTADLLVETGLREAGYQYIIIDNGWQAASRSSQGYLMADPQKFPHGIKALADYVHSKGLKLGICTCLGNFNEYAKPGSRGYEFLDARTFASWEVDYLKYVFTKGVKVNALDIYKIMRDAIYAAHRPMVFSICEWGENEPWKWGKNIGHLWRTTRNISDCLNCEDSLFYGWKEILNRQVGLEKYAGPGHWNDPDMLEVGNTGLSLLESRTHFSIWCMLAAPLIASNDLRTMTESVRSILTNREVIAIDQDILGKQGFRYFSKGEQEIWIKKLSEGNWAFCFINFGKKVMEMSIDWQKFPMLQGKYMVRDVWKASNIGTTNNTLKINVKNNDVALFRLSPIK